MNQHRILTVLALFTVLLLQYSGLAAESREITWDDLIPAEAEFDDPFTRLDDETLWELSLVWEVRSEIEAGGDVDEETRVEYEQHVKTLKGKGVDVDGLIAMIDEVEAERAAKQALTNKELEGKQVRIPGYLLPLEFDGDKVKEFFLVPYAGACIHTPPPPPNQIVHVTMSEGYTHDSGMFTPVWVEGTISSERRNANLSLVDGASEVPSSYALDASSVEIYE